jgi:hypothetical protein
MSRETLNPEPGMSPGSGFPLREMTMLEEDPVACHPGCTCGDCWQRMPPELAPVAWPEAPPQWPLTAMVRCSDIEKMRARVRRWIASGYLARAFLATLRIQVKIKAERAEVRTALWGAAAASGAAAPDAAHCGARLYHEARTFPPAAPQSVAQVRPLALRSPPANGQQSPPVLPVTSRSPPTIIMDITGTCTKAPPPWCNLTLQRQRASRSGAAAASVAAAASTPEGQEPLEEVLEEF